jgi:hypothetical protein
MCEWMQRAESIFLPHPPLARGKTAYSKAISGLRGEVSDIRAHAGDVGISAAGGSSPAILHEIRCKNHSAALHSAERRRR